MSGNEKALLPCPFCGGNAEWHNIGNEHTKSRSTKIWCSDCRLTKNVGAIRHSLEWTKEHAFKAWNRRALTPSAIASAGGGEVERELLSDLVRSLNRRGKMITVDHDDLSGIEKRARSLLATPPAPAATGAGLVEAACERIEERISVWRSTEPEAEYDDGEDESWKSWFYAAFDLLLSDVKEIRATITPSPATVEMDGKRIASRVLQRILDFDDRTSPEDQPEMLLVTGQELTDLIEEEISESALARGPLQKAEAEFEAIRMILVNELREPVRQAFWRAVSARDAIRAALAAPAEERRVAGDAIAKAVADEREACARIAYRVCAETRHVTLGDKAAKAIRARTTKEAGNG